MNKTIFILCLCIPGLCNAQAHKVDFGLSVPVFFRPAQAHTDVFSHLFGATGLDCVFRVNGTEETDISFVINTGISYDIRKYSPGVDSKVKNSLYFVNINPAVVIPSKWQHIQFCLGIGALVRLGQNVVFSWGSSGPGGGTTVDSMNELLNNNARIVVPYMSFGLSDAITTHLKLEFTIRPTLLDYYEPGTKLNFSYTTGTSSGSTLLELNYQPVYLGVQLLYFFKS